MRCILRAASATTSSQQRAPSAPAAPVAASLIAAKCSAGTHVAGGKCRVFLTASPGSLLNWTVPSDWNSNNNSIETIGAGASARDGLAVPGGGVWEASGAGVAEDTWDEGGNAVDEGWGHQVIADDEMAVDDAELAWALDA